tara:strand:+ start:47 stop:907 length:861 start_codon:yes stop_codon:yes gene_type:complete
MEETQQEVTTEVEQDTPTESAKQEEPISLMSEESAPHYGDDYDQKIEKLLKDHEEQKVIENETEEEKEVRQEETLREGESWDSVMEGQPADVQRAMQSLRSDYTRKTQAISEQRKQLEAQQRVMLESDVVKQLKEVAEHDDGEFDPFNPDSFNKYVNKVVATKMQELLQPMHEAQQKANAKAKVDVFMEKHPELKTNTEFRKDVREVLMDNEHMDLQSAYWIVKGKQSAAQKTVQSNEHKKTRDRRRQISSLVTSGARKNASTLPTNVKEMSAWEIYESLKSERNT